MKKSVLIYALGVATIFSSCTNTFCKRGNGNIETKTSYFSDFSSVSLDGEGTLTLIPRGAEGDYKLLTSADENIHERLVAELRGDELVLEVKKCIKKGDISYVLEVPRNLSGISINGAGDVQNTDTLTSEVLTLEINGAGDIDIIAKPKALKALISGAGDITGYVDASQIEIDINGAGDVTFRGRTTIFEGNVDGAGDIKCFGLPCEHAIVNINGAGNAEVNVSQTLDVVIKGAGDVHYMGSPDVHTSITGAGNIKKR